MKEKENGISLISLIITLVVIIILASISVKMGTNTIRNTGLQTFKTNMLLIEAKTKEYVENASYDLGVKPNEATEDMKTKAKSELKGTPITDSDNSKLEEMGIDVSLSQTPYVYIYKLSTEDLDSMGLKNVDSDEEDGFYIVIYNVPDVSVKIYNTKGFDIGNNNVKYCLDDIRDINHIE